MEHRSSTRARHLTLFCAVHFASFHARCFLCFARCSNRVLASSFSGSGLSARRPTPNLEDQGLFFVWPLPFDQSGMVRPARDQSPHRHSSLGHWDTQAPPPQQGASPRWRAKFLDSHKTNKDASIVFCYKTLRKQSSTREVGRNTLLLCSSAFCVLCKRTERSRGFFTCQLKREVNSVSVITQSNTEF